NAQTEIFPNIIAYAALNGQFDFPTYSANLIAAINGTARNAPGSQRWIASAGSGTAKPAVGTSFLASGGTDGTSGLTDADMIGVDTPGARTGIYAFRGTGV